MTTQVDRRSFLRKSSLMASAALIAPSLTGLVSCSDPVAPFDPNGIRADLNRGIGGGYGKLEPVKKYPEISIPRGFHAERLSVRGDMMDDGVRVPQALDGMGAFAMGGNIVRLVRNHEIRDTAGSAKPFAGNPYDAKGPAGTTTLEVELRADGAATLRRQFSSLTGTFVNCAGGITPWGSWITSEETVAGTGAGWLQNHGYNFEVPASANGPVTPVPLKEMGRFAHEAVAVDPATGIVYQTEDRNPSGFYRYIPNVRGNLAAGGKLEMLAVTGAEKYDTRRGQTVGVVMQAEWVPIANPNSDAPTISSGFVFNQGFALGGAQFARLEGCWYGDGGIYFNSTSGGEANAGQIFKYTPTSTNGGELVMIYESPSLGVLKNPDNVCVSPRGGIVLCEDSSGTNFVRGLTPRGEVFDFV
ncbi:MAG TPA: alkaline phosphatase PhoX, partial [Gemmatimonas sp.]|nr:alkaline phosphatase PhoX [Gemmatimonas sp.]